MKIPFLFLALTAAAFSQGPLTPPGAPAPTMKTLDQIEPRTPISSLPFTITAPGSYYLTGSLSTPATLAIEIQANGVTLDLGGFTLSMTDPIGSAVFVNSSSPSAGNDVIIRNGHLVGPVVRTDGANPWTHVFAPSVGGGHGVLSNGSQNGLQIHDLTISGFGNGILANTNSRGLVISKVSIRDCREFGMADGGAYGGTTNGRARISDVTVSQCGGPGIAFKNSIIDRAHVFRNTGDGLFGNSNVVTSSSAIENGGSGFAGTASVYRSVVANSNREGIFGDGVNLDGVTLGGNRQHGYSGNNSVLRAVKASGNSTSAGGLSGVSTFNSTLTDVVSDNNAGPGISAFDSILTNCRAFGTPAGFNGIQWSGKAFNCLADSASPALP